MDNLNQSDVSNSEKVLQEEKAVYKRRSLVFQSRMSTFDAYEGAQHIQGEKSVDSGDTTECPSKIQQETAFNLEEYIKSLREERKEWIETYKQRKAERRKLKKQKLYLDTEGGQPLDLSILSDSEKAFVTARPNYMLICKNNQKLTVTTSKISLLNQMIYELNERFILQMEKRLRKVTDKIIETSES
ncbi:uncharacterized protein LOC128880640 [Hylaeus volcanicus]|uniref:uncharacterized protein LOC128880640 n=1 Tax=Hylaeus volcanicus TaxID=313075 RepID=UPI0023B78C88|nr:uncharacterized protein LOC128880640 [Hylaeus volcanicus]